MSDNHNDDLSLHDDPPAVPPPPAYGSAPTPSPAPQAPKAPTLADRLRDESRGEAEALKNVASAGGLVDFLNFRTFLYPVVVKYFYIFMTILAILGSLGLIAYGIVGEQGGARAVIVGLFYLVIGPIMVRIGCEVSIVLFKIYEEVRALNENLKK